MGFILPLRAIALHCAEWPKMLETNCSDGSMEIRARVRVVRGQGKRSFYPLWRVDDKEAGLTSN